MQYVPLPLDEKREYHTIAGLLMEYLQRIPQTGEEVQVGDYLLKTLQVESHRVQKVQLIPLHNGEPDQKCNACSPAPACLRAGRRRVSLAIRLCPLAKNYSLSSSFFTSLPLRVSLLRSAQSLSRRFASSCKCLRNN